MGITIPAGYGQAALVFAVAGRGTPMVSTMGYQVPGSGTPSEHAEAIRVAWSTGSSFLVAANMNIGYTFRGVQVAEQTLTGPLIGQSMFSVIGTFGNASLPSNCAWLIRKNTSRGGRKGRGRMYLPPCTVAGEGEVDLVGNMAESFRANLEFYSLAALSAMDAADCPAYLLHEENMEIPDRITSVSVSGVIATQRRRIR